MPPRAKLLTRLAALSSFKMGRYPVAGPALKFRASFKPVRNNSGRGDGNSRSSLFRQLVGGVRVSN